MTPGPGNDLRHIAVIDIGKTNVKLALVDLPNLTEIAVITRPNLVIPGPPWPHFDTETHWAFILSGLAQFHRDHRVDAISITTHGAAIALLDANGDLAAPILDYEHTGPQSIAAAYDAIRPDFRVTGSPRLANGLNVGAQLHWQFTVDPGLHGRTAHILTYPQFWAHRLCGVLASDVSSLGCHTDLWRPRDGAFSGLAGQLNITGKLVSPRPSDDRLGPILPQIARQTGLAGDTPVACGIHDSNASLYPHLLAQHPPFSVVSTGTWVIVMTVPDGPPPVLPPARDTLFNVSGLGQAVPSARFMGGREFDIIQGGHPFKLSGPDIAHVLDRRVMLLPAVDHDSGPFQGRAMAWHGGEPKLGSGHRAAALSLYLALMSRVCLCLTGATGPIIVEGPFARNRWYLAMLAAATGRPVLQSPSATGTSLGAALLFGQSAAMTRSIPIKPPENHAKLQSYADAWQRLVEPAP